MNFTGVRIGVGVTGSFCTHKAALEAIRKIKEEGGEILPILSASSATISTRFMSNRDLIMSLEEISGKHPLVGIEQAEPIGPKKLLDVMVVIPCSGNTLAKLANGITDSAVLMACKSTLRNGCPVVLAISTNDALAGSAKNIGALLGTKNYYFVPFRQDDPLQKPCSVVADYSLLSETIECALKGQQKQPVLLG